MENATMGRVVVAAKIENLMDLYDASRGRMMPEQVRRVEVSDALVDTGATFLSLSPSKLQELGLNHFRDRPAKTAAGDIVTGMYEAVRLTIQGRQCTVDVVEVAEGSPVLIGQIPLEAMDFVIDPRGCRLIGNPQHGGEHMVELY